MTKGTPLSGLQLSVPGLAQLTVDSEVMDKYEKAFIAERKLRVERGDGAGRCSLYLLHSYKSANSDAHP